MMDDSYSSKSIADAARKALEASKLPPREHFARLVQLGWIDAEGRVTKMLGGDAEPDPTTQPGNGAPR